MKNIKETSNRKKRIIFILLWGFIFILFLSLGRNILKIKKAKERLTSKEGKVEKLKKENEELKKRLDEVASSGYIEKQLRDSLGYVKEGEIVIILPEEDIVRSLAPGMEEEEERLPDPIWKKWLKLFL